jgi:hypothetical protein
MKKQRAPRAGALEEPRRKHRPRPIPKWLRNSEKLDAIARSRCLMVLSVLSGEKPVTDAIEQARIARGTYYQMETRALNAMLAALNPLATVSETAVPDLSATRIEALLERITQLEQDKRRTQRLLLLTRKTIRAPLTTGRRGRISKKVLLGSMPIGKMRSPSSKAKASSPAGSTPTRAGEHAR